MSLSTGQDHVTEENQPLKKESDNLRARLDTSEKKADDFGGRSKNEPHHHSRNTMIRK